MTVGAAQTASALDEARAIYVDPRAAIRAAQRNGARLCGIIGADVPEELILAAGYLPVRLRGEGAEGASQAGLLAEPVTSAMLAHLVDGTYDYLDGLVIDRSLEAHTALFFHLRQIRLVEPEIRLPTLHFFDLLHLPHLTSARYNRDRVRELADILAVWSDSSLDEGAVASEIAAGNARRRELMELATMRTARPPRIGGADSLALIGCAMLMPRTDYTPLLRRALDDAARMEPRTGRRLFLTGSNHESDSVYTTIESRGFVIVGEDHDWGDRSYADPIDERVDWLDSLTDRAMFGAPAAAKYGLAERVRYICERVRQTGAEAVLSVNRIGDDAALWEFPDLQAALRTEGIACARIEGLPYGAAAAVRVAEWLDASGDELR